MPCTRTIIGDALLEVPSREALPVEDAVGALRVDHREACGPDGQLVVEVHPGCGAAACADGAMAVVAMRASVTARRRARVIAVRWVGLASARQPERGSLRVLADRPSRAGMHDGPAECLDAVRARRRCPRPRSTEARTCLRDRCRGGALRRRDRLRLPASRRLGRSVRGSSSVSSRPDQKRSARSGSSAGNSISESRLGTERP